MQDVGVALTLRAGDKSRGLQESLIIDSTEAPQRTWRRSLPIAISFQRSLPRYRYSETGVWVCLHLVSGMPREAGRVTGWKWK